MAERPGRDVVVGNVCEEIAVSVVFPLICVPVSEDDLVVSVDAGELRELVGVIALEFEVGKPTPVVREFLSPEEVEDVYKILLKQRPIQRNTHVPKL